MVLPTSQKKLDIVGYYGSGVILEGDLREKSLPKLIDFSLS